MKAALVLDQGADLSTLTEELRDKVKFVPGRRGKVEAIFPAGTIFEGLQAIVLCRTGQAAPADDECAKALGLSDAQRKSLQLDYKMTSIGVHRPEDREMYRAGIITGFDKDGHYIHGPNWENYLAAKVDVAKEGDDL